MAWGIVTVGVVGAFFYLREKLNKISIKKEFCMFGIESYCFIKKNYVKIKSGCNNNFENSYLFNKINNFFTFPFHYFNFLKNILIKILNDNPKIKKIINNVMFNEKNRIIKQKIKQILIKILSSFPLFSNKLLANICFYIYIANFFFILSNFINILSSPNKIIFFIFFKIF